MSSSLEDWINKVKETIKEIESLEGRDRLECVSGINKCNKAILASYMGWNSWLTNPIVMNDFTEEDLRQILNEFKEVAITVLKNDLKWTLHVLEKLKNIQTSSDAQFYV